MFQSWKDQDYQPSLMHLTIHLSQLKVREKVLMIEAGKGIYDHHAALQRILEGIPTEEKDKLKRLGGKINSTKTPTKED